MSILSERYNDHSYDKNQTSLEKRPAGEDKQGK